MRVDPKTIGNT